MAKLRKRVFAELGKDAKKPVTLIGTRFDESPDRRRRMEQRGETWDKPWTGDDGGLYLSPIAVWSEDDVWTYLGSARNGEIPSHTNYNDLWEIYTAGSGTTCAVVADMALGSTGKSRPCSSRTGCFVCVAVGEKDKSLSAMIDNEPDKYAYLTGLNNLRNFLFATRFDWSRRSWISRTLNQGWLEIQPDLYAPRMLEELLRYCMTCDADERAAAARLGITPRFQIINEQVLIAIDAEWSRLGYFAPFHALAIYRDIVVDDNRYPVPSIPTFARTPIPAPRYVLVGQDWDEGVEWANTGLRNPMLEMFEGCPISNTATLKDGTVVMDVRTDSEFSVDEEGAFLTLDLETDYLLDNHHNDGVRCTFAYHHYLNTGVIALSSGARSKSDAILRRTAFKERHGLTGPEPDVAGLLARSISRKEMLAQLPAVEEPVSILYLAAIAANDVSNTCGYQIGLF
ncbi:MAG: 3'-phosphoadenosine 5'-phosphosulfate sulfotransferase [Gammaproteobacteria bacterium]